MRAIISLTPALDAGEPNQNGNEDCTAMDPQNEGYGVG